MPYWGWIVIGIAAAAAIVAVLAGARVGRTRRLRAAFGPEYDRTVDAAGDRSEAEAELLERRKRREQLDIRELDPGAREQYLDQWRVAQERFVDDPPGATIEADQLVLDVMRARGYPELVGNYRSAHAVAVKQSLGEASTGDLRQAMRHYRALFDELLETGTRERVVR